MSSLPGERDVYSAEPTLNKLAPQERNVFDDGEHIALLTELTASH